MSKSNLKSETQLFFRDLQERICAALEKEDGKGVFEKHEWQREGGGGGRTMVMQEGAVIEKGGVNFSAVEGELPEKIAKALGLNSTQFFATGVSIVIHPHNPWVPIIHMNVRYFETGADGKVEEQWFGGGIDLTPHYIIPEQAKFFHKQLENTCDLFGASLYPHFKKWADDYFFIQHRNETRGIGGIFFDRLKTTEQFSMGDRFEFVKAVGNTFAPTYTHLMALNKDKSFTADEKNWQLIRRGRYVEFNLVYDKGTKFGLDTNGRIESILMSLPKLASWPYDPQFADDSKEKQTQKLLQKGIDWLS
ncbi:MAG: oxygen-dependent coproporphyrinogen oxidase [Flavobacteriales bacterium]